MPNFNDILKSPTETKVIIVPVTVVYGVILAMVLLFAVSSVILL